MADIIKVEGLVEIPEVKTRPRLPWEDLTEPGSSFIIAGVTKKRAVPPPKKLGITVATKLVPEGLQVIRVS